MDVLHTDLFPLERLLSSEIERQAYITGNSLLSNLVVDNDEKASEIEGLEEEVAEISTQLEATQQALTELKEKNDNLLTDIQTALDWIDSDKCKTLDACRELSKRLRQRLIDNDHITPQGTP